MKSPKDIPFSFGKDRKGLSPLDFNEGLVVDAQEAMLQFMGVADLRGMRLIDVGCGAGLMSLASCRAGAAQTVSLDIDPFQIRIVEKARELYDPEAAWAIQTGSVLDPEMPQRLGRADIVYAWNSLDQSGRMWSAIQSAAALVEPSGLLYLGLFATDGLSEKWTNIKRIYHRATWLRKRLFEIDFALKDKLLAPLLPCANVFKGGLESPRRQPTPYFRRVRQWLRNQRYEHARPEEVIRFVGKQMQWELVNLDTTKPVIEYLFRRPKDIP